MNPRMTAASGLRPVCGRTSVGWSMIWGNTETGGLVTGAAGGMVSGGVLFAAGGSASSSRVVVEVGAVVAGVVVVLLGTVVDAAVLDRADMVVVDGLVTAVSGIWVVVVGLGGVGGFANEVWSVGRGSMPYATVPETRRRVPVITARPARRRRIAK